MNIPSEFLHNRPLFFSAAQKQELDRILRQLADRIAAPLVLIADITGQLVLYRGRLPATQCTALAALAAGSFAAGVEMGNFLGLRKNNAFRQQLHEGAAANLYTVAIGEELLLVVAFTPQTSLGLVRVYTQQVQKDLKQIIELAIQAREADPKPLTTESDLGEKIQKQLDDLF